MIDRYCKAKGINFSDINKPEFVDKVLKRYAFQDWIPFWHPSDTAD